MFSYEIIKSLNDMELLVYDYLMKTKEKIFLLVSAGDPRKRTKFKGI